MSRWVTPANSKTQPDGINQKEWKTLLLIFFIYIIIFGISFYCNNYQVLNGLPFTKFYSEKINNTPIEIIDTPDYGIEYLFGGDMLTCATITSKTLPIILSEKNFYNVIANKATILSDNKLYSGSCNVEISK